MYYDGESDPFCGELKYVRHPDNTVTLYEYSTNSTGKTIIESTGEPDSPSAPAEILNGTKTITVQDTLGLTASVTRWAIVNRDDLITSAADDVKLSEETYNYNSSDPLKRTHTVTDLAGRVTGYFYSDCCGLDYTVDADGVKTKNVYDDLKRLVATRRLVAMNGATEIMIEITNRLDAAGRVIETKRLGTNGSTILLQQTAFDELGRVVWQSNPLGGGTTNLYLSNGNGLREVTLYPDGGTRTNDYYRDGALEKLTGTAVFGVQYERGVVQDGDSSGPWREFTKETKLKTDYTVSDEWTMTYTDGAGRSYKTVYAPRPNDSTPPYSQTWYNNLGHSWKQRDPDDVITLFGYNAQGQRAYVVQALSDAARGWTDSSDLATALGSGTYTVNTVDRITRTTNYALPTSTSGRGCDITRVDTCVWNNGETTGTLVSRSETSTTGLQSWQTVYPNGGAAAVTDQSDITIASAGNNWTRTMTQVAPDGTQTISKYQYGRLKSTTRKDNTVSQVGKTTYGYDPHGRQCIVTDARNGTTVYGYNDADQVTSATTPPPGTGQAAQTTRTEYNQSLQATNVIQPDSTFVRTEYFAKGLLKKTWGSRIYPVEYDYDYAGRMRTMTTWQNFNEATGQGSSGSAVTTWNYNTNRGWLDSKDHPNASSGAAGTTGPDYEYTAGGRLEKRYWARTGTSSQRIATIYKYGFNDTSTDNEHGDLTEVSYANDPQNTPTVAYTYDRLGRQQQIDQGGAITTRTYNDMGRPLTESYGTGHLLAGLTVTNGYDNHLRRNALSLNSSPALSTSYSYDNAGRLETVSGDGRTATYAYHQNSSLVNTVTLTNGGTTRLVTTKSYDHLNRLSAIANTPYTSTAGTPVSDGYLYNDANQRVRATLADGSFWLYEYDAMGQVKNGKKYWSDWTPVAGQQFEYAFDDIGNRTQTKSGGDQAGANLRPANYSANKLNQYTGRDVPGYVDVTGVAVATNTVTVNTSSTYRKGEYFREELPVANTSVPVWQSVNVAATGETPVTGNIFVPQTPEQYDDPATANVNEGYDDDGNQLRDGRWTYTWDAENRLVKLESLANAPTGSKRRLEFAYDYQSRRIWKKVTSLETGGGVLLEQKFVYDGWNIIATLNPQSSILASFTWGLDLSGSLQGAGGVGGLLWESEISNAQIVDSHFAAYDGNGNVAALVKAADGTVSAQYEYGPFGEVIRATGPMATVNSFRFSTKYQDNETDLLYYGYRDYNASTGRWLSRDPIGEKGGLNLNGFVGENPVCTSDRLGLFRDDWMTCPCRCVSVAVTYSPGGASPPGSLAMYQHSFDHVFGSEISVAWTVTGNPHDCKYYQDETGTSSILTGPGGNSVEKGEKHEVSQVYPDYMGATFHFAFPWPPTMTYNFKQSWRVVFRCVSSTEDGHVVERTDSANWDQNFSYP